MPVSRGCDASDATSAFMDGCDAVGERGGDVDDLAALVDHREHRCERALLVAGEVSGSAVPARSAFTSAFAPLGLSSPAMSLMPIICAPAASSSAASLV